MIPSWPLAGGAVSVIRYTQSSARNGSTRARSRVDQAEQYSETVFTLARSAASHSAAPALRAPPSSPAAPSPAVVRNARRSRSLRFSMLHLDYEAVTFVLWLATHCHRPARITNTSTYRNVSARERPLLGPTRCCVNQTTAVSPYSFTMNSSSMDESIC